MLKKCPQCKREFVPDLTDQKDNFLRWQKNGMLIQDAFPNATPIQREQLQTGICSDKCWEAYLA